MKAREYKLKFFPEGISRTFDRKAFIDQLSADFVAILTLPGSNMRATVVKNASVGIRRKWDSIFGTITDEFVAASIDDLWKYFYASKVGPVMNLVMFTHKVRNYEDLSYLLSCRDLSNEICCHAVKIRTPMLFGLFGLKSTEIRPTDIDEQLKYLESVFNRDGECKIEGSVLDRYTFFKECFHVARIHAAETKRAFRERLPRTTPAEKVREDRLTASRENAIKSNPDLVLQKKENV